MNQADGVKLGKSRSDLISSDIDKLIGLIDKKWHLKGSIAELGAYKCGATIAMAASTSRTVYSFDVFGGLPYGPSQGCFENFATVDFDEVQSQTQLFPNIVLVRGKHETTVPKFPSQPLVMIFMDSDFYYSHIVGMKYLWPMVVPEGVIVFHDWTFTDVQRAVRDAIDPLDYSYFGHLPDSNMGMIQKRNLPL